MYDDEDEGAVTFRERCDCTMLVFTSESRTTTVPFKAPYILEEMKMEEGKSLASITIAGRRFKLPMSVDAFFERYDQYCEDRMRKHTEKMGMM